MWCEKLVRKGKDIPTNWWAGRTVDRLEIRWNECSRFAAGKTRTGQPVRVTLPEGETLAHNDVVFEDDFNAVIIHVLPTEVIVARALDERQMAILALELGNLHLPVQVEAGQIILIEETPAMAVLGAMQIEWSREVRRFEATPIMSMPKAEASAEMSVVLKPKRGRGD